MKSIYIILIIQFFLFFTAKGQIEFKTELGLVECVGGEGIKVNLLFFVRESSGNEIELLNQNYRIVTDLSGILNNTLTLESEGDFSQFGLNADNKPYFFSENTLIGSSENQISYNIECTTARGIHISDEWATIGEVQFYTDGTEDCFTVQISEPSSIYFPTYIDQLENGAAVTINDYGFSYCLSQDCEIETCKEDVVLESGFDDIYDHDIIIKASKSITASNSINAASSAIYNATQEIILLPNFEVKETSTFEIMLEGCSN